MSHPAPRPLARLARLALLALLAACGGDEGEAPPTGDDPRSLDACFADLAAPKTSFVEIQDYATADGRYRIRRARRPGSRPSVGETFAYDLVRFAVEEGTTRACVTDRGRLSYEFEHHNWDDTMEARTSAASYRIHEWLDPVAADARWTFTLTVSGPDGARREGPLPLVEAGCRTLPYNLNGCPTRMRTDAAP